MTSVNEGTSGLVIGAVFSLADNKSAAVQDIEHPSTPTRSQQDRDVFDNNFEYLISNSPVPIKHCSVRVDNFIEKDIRNKITEACNNAIVKHEPCVENEQTQMENDMDRENASNDVSNQIVGRPSRKRKPNSLLSSEFLFKDNDIREYQKIKCRKKVTQEAVTCKLDHDLVMSVAEKCLPEVVEKCENKEEIKMVSIIPPTLHININNTPVLVDWKEKITSSSRDVEKEPSRPQTARTKKRLRTQEQIDKEKEEKCTKVKQKSKLKGKKKQNRLSDPSPPHLEPYGGQPMEFSSTDTPRSPGLPPHLNPYEIGSSDENKINKQNIDTAALSSGTKAASGLSRISKHSKQKQLEMDKCSSDTDRVPCSLTGRMRKPNQQYDGYQLTDVSKVAKPTPRNKPKETLHEKNITIDHDKSTASVNPSIPSAVMNLVKTTSPAQSTPSSVALPAKQNAPTNHRLSSAIGELAKMENTKKFFQLVVGDKIVLIPTDGSNVVPKAFVMDIAATLPGSSIAQNRAARPTIQTSNQKTFLMNIGGSRSTSSATPSTTVPNKTQIAQNVQTTPALQSNILLTQNVPSMPKVTQVFNTAVPSALSLANTSNQVSSALIPSSITASKVIFQKNANPVIGNLEKPFPTFIVANNAGVLNQTPILKSVLTTKGDIETECSKSPVNPSLPSTVVKTEPDNIKDYEKAAASFKGVPDNSSDTESEDETRSNEGQRPMQTGNLATIVPEVDTHVPASENETGERIRKLKEKMRQQQLEIENLRKTLVSKEDTKREDA